MKKVTRLNWIVTVLKAIKNIIVLVIFVAICLNEWE